MGGVVPMHKGWGRKEWARFVSWFVSMCPIETFLFSRNAPLRIQLTHSHSPKRRFSHGITSDGW